MQEAKQHVEAELEESRAEAARLHARIVELEQSGVVVGNPRQAGGGGPVAARLFLRSLEPLELKTLVFLRFLGPLELNTLVFLRFLGPL